MKVYLGADHAGWELKEALKTSLNQEGYEVIDMGNENLVTDDDYPDFGHAVAMRVASEEDARGIVACGNAQGICIVANKVKGIRAATGFEEEAARTARTDDDSNILCLPGRFMKAEEAIMIAKTWLETPFSGEERHVRRLKKVEDIEEEEYGV